MRFLGMGKRKAANAEAPNQSTRSGRLHGHDLIGVCAGIVLVGLIVTCILGPSIAPYDANRAELVDRLIPPAWHHDGSWSHPLGTDGIGRDVLSRVIVGARADLLIGCSAAAIAVGFGAVVGGLAGITGGTADSVITRLVEVQMGFPQVLSVVLILTVFGSGGTTLVLALAAVTWMLPARVVRAEVLRIRSELFYQAAAITGMSRPALYRKHLLPHLRGLVLSLYLLDVPKQILAAAGLSFVGLGVQPPTVSWGLMIGESQTAISVAPWASVFPGLAIILTTAALYLFASWVEPRIDPLHSRADGGVASSGTQALDDALNPSTSMIPLVTHLEATGDAPEAHGELHNRA